ncbi:hypothetical protein ACM66B_005043 [Microbotryomycetes sp. NB124-2]
MAPQIGMRTFRYASVPGPEAEDTLYEDTKRASDVDDGSSTDESSDSLLLDDDEWVNDLEGQRHRRTRLRKLLWTLVVIVGSAILLLAVLWTSLDVTASTANERIDAGSELLANSTDANVEGTDGSKTDAATSNASTNATLTNQPPRAFTIHFHGEDAINRRDPIDQPACPIRVEYTEDEEHADAVVWNSDSYDGLTLDERIELRKTRPEQKHVIWGAESAPNRGSLERFYQSIDKNGHSELYDADMTYRLNGSVPGTYSYGFFNYSTQPIPYEEKRQDKIAAAFVTNCHPRNARSLILQHLIELLPGQIDSFGRCHGNSDAEQTLKELGAWQEVGPGPTRWNIKIATMKRYKFAIAFENSNDLDYVTEKFFQPLEQGVVPLVFGAPDMVRRFYPSSNAAIDVGPYLSPRLRQLSTTDSEEPDSLSETDKSSLADLAQTLQHLSSPEGKQEYLDMLSWKLNDEWKESSPLGKVVKLNEGYDRDCKLAGVLRGSKWATSNWTDPGSPGPMDEIWNAVRMEEEEEERQRLAEQAKESPQLSDPSVAA